MSQTLFREFIEVFKLWPVDATKINHCLGAHLRKLFNQQFKHGELTDHNQIDMVRLKKMLEGLKPIANNEYRRRYPRINSFACLGLNRDQCRIVLSEKSIEIYKKQIQSWTNKHTHAFKATL